MSQPSPRPTRRTPLAALVAVLAACGGSGSGNPAEPIGSPGALAKDALAITAVSPSAIPSAGGASVSIDGTGFGAGMKVQLGGADAPSVTVDAPTHAVAVAPPHAAGAVDVLVRSNGRAGILPGGLRYVDPPVVSFVNPGHLPQDGGAVIVGGSGFQAGARVLFGADASAGDAQLASSTQLVAAAGPHAPGAVDVTVVNPDGQRSTLPAALQFDAPVAPPAPVPAPSPAAAPPSLASLSPASGPETGGTIVSLTGSGLDPLATATFGGAPATVTAVTATSLTAIAPPHPPGAVDVVVSSPDGQQATLAGAYAYVALPPPPPSIASLSPAAGPDAGGTTVVLAGSGFQAGASVSFGGAAAVPVARTPTSLTVLAPAHPAGAIDVVVANPDAQQATLAAGYTYVASAPPPPSIAGVSPSSGSTLGGTPAVISGTGFDAGATVVVGGAPATVSARSATSLAILTPAHAAGAADVVVVNGDGQSVALAAAFGYVAPPPPPPALVALSPADGPDAGGTLVALAGQGFQPGAAVAFGGTAAVVGTITSTSIVAQAPAHAAGAVDVTVTNPDGQASTVPAAFTYLAPAPPPPATPAPVLAAVVPASGAVAGGDAVALSGDAFQPGASVTLGGVSASVLSVAPTSIAIVTPPHAAGAVDVTVTNPDGQATILPAAFAYVAPPPPPPAFAALSPSSGPIAGGTAVTLAGSGFASGAKVTFGGALATVTASTATSISAIAPAHAAGAVDVAVANPDGQASALAAAFVYVAPPPPPSLASLSPASGPTAGGTAVVLAGGAFSAGATVTFGGAAALVTAASATSLAVTAPAHAAGAVDVAVTNADGQTATLAGSFTYVAPPAPPALASVTPASGTTAGGTSVVLAGAGFASGATVTVGGLPATVGGVTATAVTITTPAHAAGAVDVVVANPDGQASTLAAAFTYVAPPPPPALASVTPASGVAAGGDVVTLAGTGFAAGATVAFGGAAATVTSATSTSLSVATPAGAAGAAVDVSVTNPGGQASTLAAAFTYVAAPPPAAPPIATRLSPASGPTVGGTTVVIAGSDFRNAIVWFGGLAGAAVAPFASSATSLSVVAPPHAAGAVDVVVQNADGQTATLAAAFTYVQLPTLPPPAISGVSPTSGPQAGNTVVTISGTGFVTGSTVTIGGVPAVVGAGAVTATAITVTTPGGSAGPADVTVVNPDRQSATLAGGFTYVAPPPVVTAINVRGSPQAGGGLLLFAGSGLQNTVSVTFGGAPATGLTFDPVRGTLTVTVPPSPSGPTADVFVDLVLTNADGQTTTWPGFHYGNPPAPASFTPTTGPRGTVMTIAGTDFAADATGLRAGLQVSFGGTLATLTAKTPTQLTVTVPKLNPGSYQVIVVNFDSQFGIAPGVFVAPGP